jgi:hypothetical protein
MYFMQKRKLLSKIWNSPRAEDKLLQAVGSSEDSPRAMQGIRKITRGSRAID